MDVYKDYYEYYLIKSLNTNNIYYTNVKYYTKNENPYMYYLIFGGKKIECMDITIKFDLLNKKWIAHINQLQHDKDCIINKELNRKNGTLDFLHSCFLFVIKKFPFVNEFKLEDNSTVECKENRKQIQLSTLYIIKHNNTWYGKNFDATIDDKTYQIKFLWCLDKLNDEKYKNENFKDYILFKNNFRFFLENINDDVLDKIYKESKTIREFVLHVINTYKCENYTKFLGNLFNTLFEFNPTIFPWSFVYRPIFDIKIQEITSMNQSIRKNLSQHNKHTLNNSISKLNF